MAKQEIVPGNNYDLVFTIKMANLSYTFVSSGMTVAPSIGDKYSVDGNLIVVTSVDGANITAISTLAEDTLSATGTLERITGSGDNSITYTSQTSTNLIDTTNVTVKFSIIREIKDDPTGDDIILAPKTLTLISADTASYLLTLTVAETTTFPAGNFKGVLQLSSSPEIVNEQLNKQAIDIIVNHNTIN